MNPDEQFPDELMETITPLIGPRPFDIVDDPKARQLLTGFESLGFNCEFGLLQRRYGAEPLGLLKWANVFPEHLIGMLNGRFEGYGERGSTGVVIESWGEIILHDRKFHTLRHSFVLQKDVNQEEFLNRECRRLQFLRDKLVADLAIAEKVFVYHFVGKLTEDQIEEIFKALRQLGESRLLIVQSSGQPGKVDQVEARGDGLYVGYIDRFGNPGAGSNDNWDISFDSWMNLISKI